ncbi:DNA end protector [Acidovorax phage ACP17]|uniref:DNA end protector during packaging n=1 Tax=Acidovorax phage ACP17 TaxID=2010329 RepID=A0A218M3G0_9CAUD|nr:DNA end protector [Acidovorax phage ACP17]ASD50577.1 DNA end protector during packaging [Acidovorax phage ACP17]
MSARKIKARSQDALQAKIKAAKNKVKPPDLAKPVPTTNNPIEKSVRSATRKDMDSAIAWFYKEIKGELGADGRAKSRIRRIPDKAFNPSRDAFIGGLFFYVYDAKHKDTLPYWDQFPLVIPVSLYSDGFLGLNLHYLPPIGRARLLDLLVKYKRRAATPKAYMKLSYELLKSAVDTKLFGPCVHRYLTAHIRSDIVKVADEYWERAAMLPVQKFTGATAQQVWRGKAPKKKA